MYSFATCLQRWYGTLLCLLITGFAQAQNVSKVEWFVDQDPGFGQGSPVSVIPGADVAVAFQFDISPFANGFHNLYVRSYVQPHQVTVDGAPVQKGGWSLTHTRQFYKETFAAGLPNITGGEYFIDTDPGIGSGKPVSVSPGANIGNLSFSFDITSLSLGFHNLYVRFRNAAGQWSHAHVRTLYKEDLGSNQSQLSNVTAGEYFIDADPGFGAGKAIAVTPSTNISAGAFVADLTGISNGFHILSTRFRNAAGRWSLPAHRSFYKEEISTATVPNVVGLEYYIDTDPGFGKGAPVALTASTNISAFSFPIDMTNVSIGNHRIYVRAKDDKGRWSLVSSGKFEVEAPAAIYITIGTIAPQACAGTALDIPFTVNMPYGSNNIFTAQLSDAAGNFTYPVNIGTLTGSNSGTIQATIPTGASVGDGYKVRIIASSPLDTSVASSTALRIRRVPEQWFGITGKAQTCIGAEFYTLNNAQPDVRYTWTVSGNATIDTTVSPVKITWMTAGAHTITVTPSNGCGKGQPTALNVMVYTQVPQGVPVITQNNRDLYASAYATNTANAYQWYRNDSLQAGATGGYLYAAIDAVYKVAYINTCGTGTASAPVTVSTRQQQTISFDSIPNKVLGVAPFAVSATASSGLAITYNVVSGPAYVSSNTVTLTGVGAVVIRATQQGNNTYAPASADRSFVVVAAPAPDVTVLNVTSPATVITPGDSVTVAWSVKNIGTASHPGNWSERIYMQSTNGSNRTLLRQVTYNEAAALDTAQAVVRTARALIPQQFSIGDDGVFVVEVIPAQGVNEVAGGNANNTSVQATAWAVKKSLKLTPATVQLTEGGASVAFSISRTGSLTNPLTVSLGLLHPARFSAPASVTIEAGQAGASFAISVKENNVIEGLLRDTLTAAAAGFEGTTAPLVIVDNDNPVLTISNLPAQAMEGDTVRFKVSTNLVSTTPLSVYLTASNAARFPVPSPVVIPAGAQQVDVAVILKQDALPEVEIGVTVTAGAANHVAATGMLQLKDDDLPNLQLVLATRMVSEGAGPSATRATLRRLDTANKVAFTANLSADIPGQLIFPATVSLLANENEKTFTIGVIENSVADGQRSVAITASLYVSSCGCSAPPTSSGYVTDTLKVNDNDGATLTVSAPQLTLAEGATFPAALRITRNTTNTAALVVTLSSSDITEATVPATVTIPAGQNYVDVAVTTIADGITDGSQQVYFTASAPNMAAGTVWVMVTDLNKPDFQVSAVALGANSVQALGIFNYNVTVRNSGFSTAPAGAVLKGWLSKDTTLDVTDTLIVIDTVRATIAAGQTASVINAMAAPDMPGSYHLLFKINADLAMAELLPTNNTSRPNAFTIKPAYTATAIVALPYFKKATPVPVTGSATNSNGTPAANKPVEVYVITEGIRRTVAATTDANGNYAAHFTPLAREAGHYTIGASFPGLQQTAMQDAFDILGVKVNDGTIPQLRVVLGDTLRGTLPVQNLSNQALTNFHLAPVTLPGGSKMVFDTLATLAGDATANVGYKVWATAVSAGNNYQVASFQATAAQGAVQPVDLFYYCQAPNAYLSADITNMDVAVSQSAGYRLVEFKLVNKGRGSSGTVNLSLPQSPWIVAMTPTAMQPLAPGDTATVVLKFLAHASLPFDYTVNGTVGVNAQSGNSISLPFSLIKTSETKGAVKVAVTNQFTYYSAGEPKVAGALVKIKNYFSGVVYAEGMTGADGTFRVTGIPEGRHRITVEKEKHQSHDGTITIKPGDTVETSVFLNYRAIEYSWTVVPTAVQDEYTITLNAQFETHVPMPVVTIDMPKTMPQLTGNETYAFNVTLTNHGLITAKDVSLSLPQSDVEYEFITNYVPADLLAQQSIQVPVLMRRRAAGSGTRSGLSIAAVSRELGIAPVTLRSGNANLKCSDYAGVSYWYTCSISSGMWEKGGTLISYSGRACLGGGIIEAIVESDDKPYTGPGPYNPECASCPAIPVGNGNGPTFEFVEEKKSCLDCILDMLAAAYKCLGGPDPSDLPLPGGPGGKLQRMKDLYDQASDYYDNAQTAVCLVSAASQGSLSGMMECVPPPDPPGNDCLEALADAAMTCANTGVAGTTSSRSLNSNSLKTISTAFGASMRTQSGVVVAPPPGGGGLGSEVFRQIAENLYLSNKAFAYRTKWSLEYFGNMAYSDAFKILAVQIAPYVTKLDSIRTPAQSSVLNAMAGYDIHADTLQAFFRRWNTSLAARSAGVMQPNAQYPGIIDWTKIKTYSDSLVKATDKATSLGYAGVGDLYVGTISAVKEIFDGQSSQATCASVTVQFSQRLTMTREAFEGTLSIFNGHPTDKVDSLSVNIQITDEAGVPSNGLFQINTKSLTNLSNVTGTGQIDGQGTGVVKFIFIPEVGAAPTVAKQYKFGGNIRYFDPYQKQMVTMPMSDVVLTVSPSPYLMLRYFMQRNIMGDDALTTPQIEPSEPAELAVMVENHGNGPAVNMMISSAQPEVVDNEKGLAVNFSLIGSAYQGQPTTFGLTDINFGTVPAQKTRIGQWWFTSSLLGKFVSYKADVVHANSFGNPELSLVKGVEIHELTKSIKAYGAGEDGLNDFLVNDIFDVADRPDIIYFSQGKRTAKVHAATSGSFSAPVAPPTFTNTLTVTAADTGWNYIKLPDPGNRQYEIVSVTRADGQVIPLNNAWLTYVTLPASRPPVYENKFHFVDTFPGKTTVSYMVVWKPRSFNVPKVDSITGAPAQVTTTQVQKLRVVFNKAIDQTTFTTDDLTLTLQGGANIMNNSAVITRIDTSTFDVDLTALTTGNGFYNLVVQAANVKDVYGINGAVGKNVSWTQFLNVPAVQAFQGVNAAGVAAAYNTINVLFNVPVDPATLPPSRFIVTRGGVAQGGSVVIDSVRADGKLVYLSGLNNMLTQSGEYLFTVDLPNIKSAAGVNGLQQQSISLKLDNAGPVIVSSATVNSGGLDAQHVPNLRFQFNEEVVGFNTAAVSLTRNGSPIFLNIAQLSNQGWTHWTAGDFGIATYAEGTYVFAINLAMVKDAAGNFGTGTHQITWTVDRSPQIVLSNLGVSPDLGFSNTDGITAKTTMNALFTMSAAASQVVISQTDASGETLLATQQNVAAGQVSIPVVLRTGGSTGIRIKATGSNGGVTVADLPLYVDPLALNATWMTSGNSFTTQPDSVFLQVSHKLLTDAGIKAGLRVTRNGFSFPTTALQIAKLNDTLYQVSGLRQVSTAVGNYALMLRADSLYKYSSGKSGEGEVTATWKVEGKNAAPVAKAGNNTTVTAVGPFTLNGSASFDPDADPISYKWIAPAGVVLNDSTLASPAFTVTAANHGKTYPFLLIVSDGLLFHTDVVDVKVQLSTCTTEICNGVDDDCDGLIDEGFTTTFYRDADGDGFGTDGETMQASACNAPAGYAAKGGDCNDADAATYPGAGGYGCGVCATESITFAARTSNAAAYQWQVDKGTGFEAITSEAVYSGANTAYLTLTGAPTSWTGYKFRCMITQGSNTTYSPTYTLRFAAIWNGTVSNAWENIANWGCGKLPDAYTDVIVNTAVPLRLSTDAAIRHIMLAPVANVTIKAGSNLDIKGK